MRRVSPMRAPKGTFHSLKGVWSVYDKDKGPVAGEMLGLVIRMGPGYYSPIAKDDGEYHHLGPVFTLPGAIRAVRKHANEGCILSG